jgi:hypothetical protein
LLGSDAVGLDTNVLEFIFIVVLFDFKYFVIKEDNWHFCEVLKRVVRVGFGSMIFYIQNGTFGFFPKNLEKRNIHVLEFLAIIFQLVLCVA